MAGGYPYNYLLLLTPTFDEAYSYFPIPQRNSETVLTTPKRMSWNTGISQIRKPPWGSVDGYNSSHGVQWSSRAHINAVLLLKSDQPYSPR